MTTKTLTPAAKAFKAYKADTAQTVKDRIQGLLRAIAIERDGDCFARNYPEEMGGCGGFKKDGGLILQFDHLNTRARNISYADPRLGILACLRHHFYFKKQYPVIYEKCALDFIGPARKKLLERVRADSKTYHMTKGDWDKVEIALQAELKKIQNG